MQVSFMKITAGVVLRLHTHVLACFKGASPAVYYYLDAGESQTKNFTLLISGGDDQDPKKLSAKLCSKKNVIYLYLVSYYGDYYLVAGEMQTENITLLISRGDDQEQPKLSAKLYLKKIVKYLYLVIYYGDDQEKKLSVQLCKDELLSSTMFQ